MTILSAQYPGQPLPPTTEFVAETNSLKIDWVEPDTGGSPITSYTILIE